MRGAAEDESVTDSVRGKENLSNVSAGASQSTSPADADPVARLEKPGAEIERDASRGTPRLFATRLVPFHGNTEQERCRIAHRTLVIE